MQKTNALEQLIYFFSKLPGLGHRSSRRIVLHLLEQKDTRLQSMIDILTHARDRISTCTICGNLCGNVGSYGNVDSEKICSICLDPARNNYVLAVVETVAELLAIERSGIFFGKYHVLGGVLSASTSRTPQDLKIENLVKRCKTDNVQEIILATNATIEGQTTAFYILEHFQETNIKVTKLASGIPIGGELDYLDEGTLTAAINARLPF